MPRASIRITTVERPGRSFSWRSACFSGFTMFPGGSDATVHQASDVPRRGVSFPCDYERRRPGIERVRPDFATEIPETCARATEARASRIRPVGDGTFGAYDPEPPATGAGRRVRSVAE